MLKNDSYRSGTSITSVCDCGYKCETSEHFLLHCSLYHDIRKDIYEQLPDILNMSKDTQEIILFQTVYYWLPNMNISTKDKTFSSKIFYLSSWQTLKEHYNSINHEINPVEFIMTTNYSSSSNSSTASSCQFPSM